MKRIPTIWLALTAGLTVEFLLLLAGGFDFRVGGDGPASKLICFTHIPAMMLSAILPLPPKWQTETVVAATFATVNSVLLTVVFFLIIRTKRHQWGN
ncbi:MAG: hypothetical protein A3K19_00415 [Lentisphaerae bacterium RIFOXYB12_FULL_65_16]|nr:MAG: hypothetical protein A3K18_13985 [Lentisphaerae bacterium RIFOXYA12_64_32]OGV85336.1 MAG: hypothetical protein A3K19_00415 [Lentisphaerae bacterium RIFOXYB12_FULL_65_16]